MNNDDYFAAPVRPPVPPDYPPPGAGTGLSGYSLQEQQLLMSSRSTAIRRMGTSRSRSRLGLVDRFRIGISLAGTSGRVVAEAPSLLVAPVVALVIGAVAVAATVQAMGGLELVSSDRAPSALGLLPAAALVAVVSVLASAVVVDAATVRMQLGRTSLAASWAKALGHLPDLVLFGLLSMLERLVTGTLRGNVIGRFVADLFDGAWDFATYLAVPVILYERTGPIAAVKRSAAIVRTRWVEQLVGRGAIGLALFVLFLPLVVIAVLVGLAISLPFAVVLVVGVLLVELVVSFTLTGVLSAALYRYAVTGEVSEGFSAGQLGLLFA